MSTAFEMNRAERTAPHAATLNGHGHSHSHSHDWADLQAALIRLGTHLKKPTRLVLIGSSVGMFYGQPGRMTEDVDVWNPKSQVDLADITQACAKAGIAFDPQGDDVSGVGMYLQMVKPGVVHVGKWKSEADMFVCGNLKVVHPPAENIIASKLVRCTDADIEDVVFLMRRLGIGLDAVRAAVDTLSPAAQETAQENMVMLEIHADLAGQAMRFGAGDAAAVKAAPASASTREPETPRRRMRP